ncbi:MAG TPA: aminotransferase class IV [Anaerolineales bacterium]
MTASDPARLEEVRLSPEPVSLNAASRLLPGGVYTTFRTFDGHKMLPLEDHIHRLEESAALVNATLRLDIRQIRRALHQAVSAFPQGEKRVRLTLDLEKVHGDLYITLEPLQVPSAQDYEQGVRAITCASHRDNPKAKQTSFISIAEELRRILPPDVNEGLLVDANGRILEGLSSNFFAIQDGVIWTAEEGVLAGITRATLLKIAGRLGLPVRPEGLPHAALANLQEALITSASRLVLPVTRVDATVIGSGAPGPLTLLLMQAFAEEIQADLVEI